MSTETKSIHSAGNVRRLPRVQDPTRVVPAERSGLCPSWLSRRERRAENPSIETPPRLATGPRLQVLDLLARHGSGGSQR